MQGFDGLTLANAVTLRSILTLENDMKKTVSVYDFRDAFQQIRPNNFSYEGLSILFDYLEELEDDIGEQIELDVIAICCDFAEDDFKTIIEEYRIDVSDCEDEDEMKLTAQYFLENEGAFVGITDEGTIVYRTF